MNTAGRIVLQEFKDGRIVSQRLQQFQFGVVEFYKHRGDAVLGQVFGV